MTPLRTFLPLVPLLAAGACASSGPPPFADVSGPAQIVAELKTAKGKAAGRAEIRTAQASPVIRLEVSGLTPGWHGVHLHEKGDCSAADFTSAGGHVGKQPGAHGFLSTEASAERGGEPGDLPNLYVHGDGVGRAEFVTAAPASQNTGGLLDADGSAIVIHARADDHRTQPIGGSGDRVACGVIRSAR